MFHCVEQIRVVCCAVGLFVATIKSSGANCLLFLQKYLVLRVQSQLVLLELISFFEEKNVL